MDRSNGVSKVAGSAERERPGDANRERVLIGVCTLNEAGNIEILLGRLKQALPQADILVVDDDSSDGTGEIVARIAADDASIALHQRRDQRGLGTALRYAMSVAIAKEYQYFLNLDGDLSHDPDQLTTLLDRARDQPPVDVVVGSRYADGGAIIGWPLRRRILSRLVNRFAMVFLNLPVSDCSGSMRCYRVAALQKIGVEQLTSTGYAVLEELLLRLHRRGAAIAEVPVTFTERQAGRSKLTKSEALRSAWQIVQLARSA